MGRGGETSLAIAVAGFPPPGSTLPSSLLLVSTCACDLHRRDRSRSRDEQEVEEEEARRENRKRDRGSDDEDPNRETAEHDEEGGSGKEHAEDRGKRRVCMHGLLDRGSWGPALPFPAPCTHTVGMH